MTNFSLMVSTLKQNIARAVVGKDDVVELMLTALLCEGHVLIEDVPGVGKTTLASALARSLSCSFKRIQFTPDITPSDITGFTMPSLSPASMQYRPGAIMSQIVLADEINRTSPKTQSALLEVMEERQVTVDGVTYPLARPFMVLATQNPVDFVGTYPLPEAQMDRFFMRVSIGYPSLQDEMDILGPLLRRTEADGIRRPGLLGGGRDRHAADGQDGLLLQGGARVHRRHLRRHEQHAAAQPRREHPRRHRAHPRGAGQRAALRPRLYHPRGCAASCAQRAVPPPLSCPPRRACAATRTSRRLRRCSPPCASR